MSQATSTTFQNSPLSKHPCPIHANNYLTQMCVNPNCNEPLCSLCVPIHQSQDQQKKIQSNIIPILQARQDSINDIQQFKQNIANQNKKSVVPQQNDPSSQKYVQDQMNKLSQAHQQLINSINSWFEGQKQQIVKNSQQPTQNPINQQQINTENKKCDDLLQQLSSADFVKAILITKDLKKQNYPNTLSKTVVASHQLPQYYVHPEQLDQLQRLLPQFVNTSPQNQQSQNLGNTIVGNNQLNNTILPRSQSQKPQQQVNPLNQTLSPLISKVPTQSLMQPTQPVYPIPGNKKFQIQFDGTSPIKNSNINYSPNNAYLPSSNLSDFKPKQYGYNLDAARYSQPLSLLNSNDYIHKKLHQNLNPPEAESLPEQNVLKHIPESNQLNDTEHNAIINQHDSINRKAHQRAAYYFQPDTKFLFIFDFDQDGPEYKFQKKILHNDFLIPRNHQVIVTDSGSVFLIGGIYRQKNWFKPSDEVLLYNSDDQKLVKHSNLNYQRCLHAATFAHNNIYVVGGSATNDENGTINKCEKLDKNSLKWVAIQECKIKTSGSALCGFNEYVIKIGGKIDVFTPSTTIELYDHVHDKWAEVEYVFQSGVYLRLPFRATCAQVNQTQILIVGGSIHDVRTNQSQILEFTSTSNLTTSSYNMSTVYNNNSKSIHKDHNVRNAHLLLARQLPRGGAIYSQIFIQNKELYAIQETGEGIEDQKVCLNFNGDKWSEY